MTAYGEYGYVLYSRVHGLDQMTKLQYTTTKKKHKPNRVIIDLQILGTEGSFDSYFLVIVNNYLLKM